METAPNMKKEEVHFLLMKDNRTASAGIGTTVFVLMNSVNSSMKRHLSADIKKATGMFQPVGFFTRSLKKTRDTINTEKKTSLPFSQEVNKEDNKRGRKKSIVKNEVKMYIWGLTLRDC